MIACRKPSEAEAPSPAAAREAARALWTNCSSTCAINVVYSSSISATTATSIMIPFLLLRQDDFFLSGSSTDEAEADDEWIDRSTRELEEPTQQSEINVNFELLALLQRDIEGKEFVPYSLDGWNDIDEEVKDRIRAEEVVEMEAGSSAARSVALSASDHGDEGDLPSPISLLQYLCLCLRLAVSSTNGTKMRGPRLGSYASHSQLPEGTR
ncbi:hypothetical protein ZIOFF_007628 [Zingiber officinale]|uniref:Uncharacterized protein n=1 Tax=Zingiber officinale TaxID=94328 RepID=A0A8J5HU43_ZINOF|nr:hypothetical protein ZIOFF_007628 [Zingiber officinale]